MASIFAELDLLTSINREKKMQIGTYLILLNFSCAAYVEKQKD
jgi:hypothetical protein